MSEQEIYIVMISDNNYVRPTLVSLTSIFCNKKKSTKYHITILANKIDEMNIKLLKSIEKKDFCITVLDKSLVCQKFETINKERHVSCSAILKFFIPEYFKNLNKVLYLDSDILVQTDLSTLYNTDLSDKYAAVVKDLSTVIHPKHSLEYGINNDSFFNSGMMLLNLDLMRKDCITNALLEFRLNHKNYFMDQDAFNAVIGHRVLYLSYKYNVLNCFIERFSINELSVFYGEKLPKKEILIYKDCYILHLGGSFKPWVYDMGYLSKLYKKYWNKSPLKGEKFILKKLKNEPTLLQKIFSIKNSYDKKHKIVTILGIKLKLKYSNNYNEIVNILGSQQAAINRFNFLLTNGINKEQLSYDIENFKNSGINEQPRTPKLIVSLTSFPERMYDLHFCLYSLLTQTLKPDEVILWLATEEFPNKEADLPQKVLQLKDNGLTIKWCENIGSYKKLIPAIKEYTNDIIVSADDDIFYPAEWLERLYNSYLKNPDYIHCHRAHKITFDAFGCIEPYEKWKKCIDDKTASFINFFTGAGGILYPPNCFYKDILNEDIFTQLAPRADDIWFWAMCVLNNKKIKVIENSINQITYTNPARELQIFNERTLYSTNGAAGGNDEQLKNVIEQYSQILQTVVPDSMRQQK